MAKAIIPIKPIVALAVITFFLLSKGGKIEDIEDYITAYGYRTIEEAIFDLNMHGYIIKENDLWSITDKSKYVINHLDKKYCII